MFHPMHPLLCCIALAALAGCSRAPAPVESAGTPTYSADDVRVRDTAAADRADVEAPLLPMPADRAGGTSGEAALAGRWLLQESDPPRAVWGVPDSEGILTFGCRRDGDGAQVVLEREAVGVPRDVRVVTIEADDTRIDYPAERIETTLAPNLVTRIALDAAILDRLLGARRMAVVAGNDAVVATAPAASLRAVVDACRRPAPG